MHKDFVLYHVYGRLETETFEREQITRDELPDIIKLYMAEENLTYHMILGINGDGVICSPIKDWNIRTHFPALKSCRGQVFKSFVQN